MMQREQMRTEFEAQIKEQSAAGNDAGEAEARSQYGLWLSQQGNWQAAASQFEAAAALAEAAGRPDVAAQYRHAQGLVGGRNGDNGANPLAAAIAQYEEDGNAAGLARARHARALRHFQSGDPDAARAEMNAALAALDDAPAPSPFLSAALRQNRAILRWLDGETEAALADVDAALAAAPPGQQATLRAVRRAFTRDVMGMGETAVTADADDNPDPLYRQLEAALAAAAANDADPLQRAMAAWDGGETAVALNHAQAARQAALDSPELTRYPRYLAACLLIALARERAGDDAGVIAILLTAKGTLQRHLGRRVGQNMSRLLDGLLPRWGEARFQAALAEYRENCEL
jgi:hypothetical protein